MHTQQPTVPNKRSPHLVVTQSVRGACSSDPIEKLVATFWWAAIDIHVSTLCQCVDIYNLSRIMVMKYD